MQWKFSLFINLPTHQKSTLLNPLHKIKNFWTKAICIILCESTNYKITLSCDFVGSYQPHP